MRNRLPVSVLRRTSDFQERITDVKTSWFSSWQTVFPEDGTVLPKHVGVMSLLFVCTLCGTLGWFNKRIHWSKIIVLHVGLYLFK
jgi:hypothetical protein